MVADDSAWFGRNCHNSFSCIKIKKII